MAETKRPEREETDLASLVRNRTSNDDLASRVAGATHDEEKAYWDTIDESSRQQSTTSSKIDIDRATIDQGLISKLSITEIGSSCDNLAKQIGDQARLLGDHAKTLGAQVKGYTMNNTKSAAAAMKRFQKQIVAAVDGVPLLELDEVQRMGATTTNEGEAGCGEDLHEGRPESDEKARTQVSGAQVSEEEEQVEEKEEEKAESRPEPGCLEVRTLPSSAAVAQAITADAKTKQDQANTGTVNEGGSRLNIGASSATFNSKHAGVTTAKQYQAGSGGARAASSKAGAMSCGSRSATKVEEEAQAGADKDEGTSKIIPRTASLVGGRQWAVLASIYDATASVVEETVGDFLK